MIRGSKEAVPSLVDCFFSRLVLKVFLPSTDELVNESPEELPLSLEALISELSPMHL